MGWFRKAKPEPAPIRLWCADCARIYLSTELDLHPYYGYRSHLVWVPNVIQGVDFGKNVLHELLVESEDSPTRQAAKAADGRLSLAGGGEVSLAEQK